MKILRTILRAGILKLNMGKLTITIPLYTLKKYFRENLGAPFILSFQVLFLLCVVLLARGYSELANDVSIYAYFFLVSGVILQFISFIRERKLG